MFTLFPYDISEPVTTKLHVYKKRLKFKTYRRVSLHANLTRSTYFYDNVHSDHNELHFIDAHIIITSKDYCKL